MESDIERKNPEAPVEWMERAPSTLGRATTAAHWPASSPSAPRTFCLRRQRTVVTTSSTRVTSFDAIDNDQPAALPITFPPLCARHRITHATRALSLNPPMLRQTFAGR